MTTIGAVPAANEPADSGPWLQAWYDPLCNIRTVTGCVRLADLNGGVHYCFL